MEECCLVCTEPMDYTAVGACGHTGACAVCSLRLRSAIGDKRCVYCQIEQPEVLVTRANGHYTARFPTEPEGCSARAARGELKLLDNGSGMYFDDEDYHQDIEASCAVACSVCEATFSTVRKLRDHLARVHQKYLCGVCVENRKVFVKEQILYSKEELARHMRKGDAAGPMSPAHGFKGHTWCEFCKKHFYGEAELYSHMQTAHLRCWICKKANPDKFMFYRDVEELTRHFRNEHFFCEHPACKHKHPEERVFATEKLAQNHFGTEHAEGMSRKERQDYLRIETNFLVTRPGERAGGDAPPGEPSGVSGSGGYGGDAPIVTDEEAFPSMGPSTARSGGGGGRQGGIRHGSWAGGASTPAPAVGAENFPTLGGAGSSRGNPNSKAGRRKAKQRRPDASANFGNAPAMDLASRTSSGTSGASDESAAAAFADPATGMGAAQPQPVAAAAPAPTMASQLRWSGSGGRPQRVEFNAGDFPGLNLGASSSSSGGPATGWGSGVLPANVVQNTPRRAPPSWTCGACTLVNLGRYRDCQACGIPKGMVRDASLDDRPTNGVQLGAAANYPARPAQPPQMTTQAFPGLPSSQPPRRNAKKNGKAKPPPRPPPVQRELQAPPGSGAPLTAAARADVDAEFAPAASARRGKAGKKGKKKKAGKMGLRDFVATTADPEPDPDSAHQGIAASVWGEVLDPAQARSMAANLFTRR